MPIRAIRVKVTAVRWVTGVPLDGLLGRTGPQGTAPGTTACGGVA